MPVGKNKAGAEWVIACLDVPTAGAMQVSAEVELQGGSGSRSPTSLGAVIDSRPADSSKSYFCRRAWPPRPAMVQGARRPAEAGR